MSDNQVLQEQLLAAGVHLGHQKSKWNPRMLPYVYAERKGIHIIDLKKTAQQLQNVANILQSMAREGRSILFVATKRHAKQVVTECAKRAGVPYVTERWLGGMLTNYATIKASIRKIEQIEKRLNDNSADIIKKERLQLARSKEKMEKVLGGIIGKRIPPAALFIVDIGHEHLALTEAKRLRIPTFGMVDTNCDPNLVDYPIAANDDSVKSISMIVNYITDAIIAGMRERKEEQAFQDRGASHTADDASREIRLEGEGQKRETGRKRITNVQTKSERND